jgi:hypothetical protein
LGDYFPEDAAIDQQDDGTPKKNYTWYHSLSLLYLGAFFLSLHHLLVPPYATHVLARAYVRINQNLVGISF